MINNREETRKKLDGVQKAGRIRILLAIGGATLALGIALYLFSKKATTIVGHATAVVTSARRAPEADSGRWVTVFEAKTPEGQLVRIRSLHPKPPMLGDNVSFLIRKDGLGIIYYEWIVGDDAR